MKQLHPKLECEAYIRMMFFNKDKRRHDLDNMGATVLDFLTEEGVIVDDNCQMLGNLLLQYGGIDKNNPRVEIYITEVSED